MYRIFMIIALLVFCVGIDATNAELYKWVDQDGIPHFSNSPPENLPASAIETAPEIAYDAAADAASKEQDKKEMEALNKESAEMESDSKENVSDEKEESETPVSPKVAEEDQQDENYYYGVDPRRRIIRNQKKYKVGPVYPEHHKKNNVQRKKIR